MLEKEGGGCTQIATADCLYWSVSTGNICNSHLGRGRLKANVRYLKRRLKWPSSWVPHSRSTMSLKHSFALIAFLVSHSKTYCGKRIPLLFYRTHKRKREVGTFWSFKTNSQVLHRLLKTLWSFPLTHTSESHYVVHYLGSHSALHLLPDWNFHLLWALCARSPCSSLATTCQLRQVNLTFKINWQ